MKQSLVIVVSGRVQGVFFRASAARKAEQLGLTGFVKNQPDGSVYIEAEGDENSLTEFLEWTKVGPPRAVVQKCEVLPQQIKNFSDFKVKQ